MVGGNKLGQQLNLLWSYIGDKSISLAALKQLSA